MRARKNLVHVDIPRLEPQECKDFANWLLANICRAESDSKPGPRVLLSRHMERHGAVHLRGSDQTERIFIAVTVMIASGWSEKEACFFVAEHPLVRLGNSKRGRPSKAASRDPLCTPATVRAIVNRFNRSDPMNLVCSTVGLFRWLRENRIVEGSEYVENSGLRAEEAYRRRLASLGINPDSLAGPRKRIS